MSKISYDGRVTKCPEPSEEPKFQRAMDIKNNPIYEQGYNDGYKEGYNKAIEVFRDELMLTYESRPVQVIINTDQTKDEVIDNLKGYGVEFGSK